MTDGATCLELSNALVALKKRLYGRGPERAKTYFNDDWAFCVMEGGLLPHEEQLVESGEEMLVRQYRLRFQKTIEAEVLGTVTKVVGRPIVNYQSQIMFRPTRIVEMFRFDGPVDAS